MRAGGRDDGVHDIVASVDLGGKSLLHARFKELITARKTCKMQRAEMID
jgi:hypothetical protein